MKKLKCSFCGEEIHGWPCKIYGQLCCDKCYDKKMIEEAKKSGLRLIKYPSASFSGGFEGTPVVLVEQKFNK